MLLLHILISVLIICVCEGARILGVFPTPSISHQVVFRPLIHELAKRGHVVVVLTTDPAFPKGQTPQNLTEIDVHDISYRKWREIVLSGATTSGRNNDLYNQIKTFISLLTDIFEIQMQIDEMQQLIKHRRNDFDLLLLEASIRPAVSLSHIFKLPIILVSSFTGVMHNYHVMGVPNNPPLIYPTVLHQRIYNLTFWEKLTELYNHKVFERYFASRDNIDNELIRRLFGSDIPTIQELENNVAMLFLNVHPLWESNRPVPPSVIYMGGIHQKPSKELSKDLKLYLDSSKNGVIYISFGTNVSPSSLPPEKIQMLVKAFAKLPYDVLWKWDKEELPGKSENIRISKWLPQSDLLKHPNVKLFITQGGLQSTDEAITAGVPLIGIPMLGDQWFNVEQYVYHKIGLRLDMEILTENAFLEGIKTILNDDSYRKNIVRLGKIMRDQPQPPLERAVWWTEHVLRHGGGSHLRPRVANMSWAEYLDVELITGVTLIILALVIVVTSILYLVIRIVRKYVFSGVKLKKC